MDKDINRISWTEYNHNIPKIKKFMPTKQEKLHYNDMQFSIDNSMCMISAEEYEGFKKLTEDVILLNEKIQELEEELQTLKEDNKQLERLLDSRG